MTTPDELQSWGACDECGFQGLLTFRHRPGEDYSDESAFGVMMDARCPACDQVEGVLVVMEEYREMVLLARDRPR